MTNDDSRIELDRLSSDLPVPPESPLEDQGEEGLRKLPSLTIEELTLGVDAGVIPDTPAEAYRAGF
jgi:hypothetical protein